MITDARRSNQLFRARPGVSLLSSEGFGKIELNFSPGALEDPPAVDGFTRLSLGSPMSRTVFTDCGCPPE